LQLLPVQVAVVQAPGALHTEQLPPLQPQLPVVPEHAEPNAQTVLATTLQVLLPTAQPYAVRVGCWTLQLIALAEMLQYCVQLDDAHAPFHHTCPLDDAYCVCVPGLVVGHVSVVPVQLL
jgi:hypothetical protein